MNKLSILLSIMGIICFASCMEKTGYYDAGQEAVLKKLVNKTWERTRVEDSPKGGTVEIRDLVTFKETGRGEHYKVKTYKNGEVIESTYNFVWSFTVPNFSIIYTDHFGFWQIEKLTETELEVCETSEDPLTVWDQTRTYIKFSYIEPDSPTE